jgi:hypothetical protein
VSVDSTTWAALAFVLAAIGAGWTYVSFQRHGLAAGVRGAAWTLLPIALWLTGTLRLAGDIAGDVGHWASRLVFSPAVWAGVILAGLSVVLFGASSAMRGRGVGVREGGRVPRSERKQVGPAKPGAPVVDAMDADVAAILRKHGIS